MKAISVKQPWASLIIEGIKPVENRKWKAGYHGPLLIHASKNFDQKGADYLRVIQNAKIRKIVEDSKSLRGGIIGQVEMVDCVKDYNSWWFSGPYGFVVKNPVKLDFYECKGKLNFFDVEWPPQKKMLISDRQFYIDQFKSEECQCGKSKKPRRSLCYACYMALPRHKQTALFQPIGNGYEKAYDEALTWLNG